MFQQQAHSTGLHLKRITSHTAVTGQVFALLQTHVVLCSEGRVQ